MLVFRLGDGGRYKEGKVWLFSGSKGMGGGRPASKKGRCGCSLAARLREEIGPDWTGTLFSGPIFEDRGPRCFFFWTCSRPVSGPTHCLQQLFRLTILVS